MLCALFAIALFVPAPGAWAAATRIEATADTLDCREGTSGLGYDSCEVAMSVHVRDDRRGSGSVNVHCSAEVSYVTYDPATRSLRDSSFNVNAQSNVLVIVGKGLGFATVRLGVGFPLGVDPIRRAQVESWKCTGKWLDYANAE